MPADDYSFIWPRWRRCTEHGEYHLLYVGCSGCQLDVLLSMESGRLSVVIAWGAVQEVCRPGGTGGRYAGVLPCRACSVSYISGMRLTPSSIGVGDLPADIAREEMVLVFPVSGRRVWFKELVLAGEDPSSMGIMRFSWGAFQSVLRVEAGQ